MQACKKDNAAAAKGDKLTKDNANEEAAGKGKRKTTAKEESKRKTTKEKDETKKAPAMASLASVE